MRSFDRDQRDRKSPRRGGKTAPGQGVRKRICGFLAAWLLLAAVPAGAPAEQPDLLVIENVIYGPGYPDTGKVEAAINAITGPLMNAEVRILNVDIGTHSHRINQMIANGEQIDLVMAGLTTPMVQMALEGRLLPLDQLLEAEGPEVKALFGERLEAGRVDGTLYAIPADAYAAKAGGFVYNKQIAEELGITLRNAVTISELEEIFRRIAEELPGIHGTTFGNGETCNFSYEYCVDNYGTENFLYGATLDPHRSTRVENLFATEAFRDYAHRHREWVRCGFALSGTLTGGVRSYEYLAAGKVFGMTTAYSPIEESVQQGNYTFPIGITSLTQAVNSTASNQERMWGIPVTSPHPEKAMRFLNLMFSSPEIANLLSNGLEGVHYVETEPGVITHAPGTDPARQGYGSVFSRFGDQMQVKHWVPTTPDFYRELASFNEQAQDSLSLGYVFNGEGVASEIAAVTAVVSLYLPPLECGMLEDVDGALAEFNEKLQSAGIDRIIAENQRQLDAWLAEKNAHPES